MKIRLLGTAAGGGLPQWNCACPQCDRARRLGAGRTQDCVAITGDGSAWYLLNASPDLRTQLTSAPELARVLTHATTGSAETTATAAPFAVNGFFAGSGSINAQSARQAGQDRHGGVSFTQGFTTTANPTLALPLAGGRGFWMIGILTQTGHYASAAGLRAKTWPDGNQVATPRPAVVHRETDTFITTYTAIDPPRPAGKPAGATLTLDGFFGWPLSAVAS